MTEPRTTQGRGALPRPCASRWALLIGAVCCALGLRAQSDLHLVVLDSTNAQPLFGAGALIMGTTLGGASDLDGRITIPHVPDGTHTVRVSSLGYRERMIQVTTPYMKGPLTVRLQPSAAELDEVVIEVTRTGSRIEDVPQKIEVLGAEELEEEGFLKPGNIASMIGDISSVQIQQTSASTGAGMVRMQGLDGRHTLLLRDGMPAYGGLSGGFDIMRIPPLDLQRVELLKGPASTFNGPGAIAGSINFVSKAPTDSLTALVMLNQSTLSETNANAYVSAPLGRVGFTCFGGTTQQHARDVDGDGYSDVPTAHTYLLHPQVFATLNRSDLRAGVLYQNDTRTGGDMQALDAPADTARYFIRTQGRRLGSDLSFTQHLRSNARLVVKGTFSHYDQEDHDNLSTQDRAQDNAYGEAYWTRSDDRHTWVVGASGLSSTLKGDGLLGQQLSTVGAFAQLALHRARWPEIDLGLRTDMPSGQAVQILPSVAAYYKVSPSFSLRTNVGTGYQLPDRSRSYGLVFDGVTATDLRAGTVAERSLGGTMEWTYRKVLSERTLLFFDQTFFATRIKDPLTIVYADADALLANASGSTFTRGVDNYLRVEHGATELYLGYTYTLPTHEADGTTTKILFTPLHRAAATLARTLGDHWRFGLEASWNGRQYRADGTTTRDQYFVAAMVGCTYGPWTFVLNGENVTDTRQTRWEDIVTGSLSRPTYAPLWAPIDGRVINLSAMWRF